jgi:3-oxoacyl-[acyl-carrier-protein] synthase-3
MDFRQHFQIIGSGISFPRKEVAAEEIDRRLGNAAGWTRANIGVNRRFECLPPETIATMGREAVGRAMAAAKVAWSDIDLILDCSTSRHRPIPCNAAHVQAMFGPAAQGIPCFDIQTTCLGFIVALRVAGGLMQSGTYRHILIACSEAPLAGVDWHEPEVAPLFGDAAAASTPVLLHQCLESGAIGRGSQVMLLGTSAGYSQAAIVFDV